MWFSPALDDMNAQLTTTFDLTGVSTAELTFWAWYELEEEYDFAYITISTDNGQTWDLLLPNHSSSGEYGPAFNGFSGDENDATNQWVHEAISLNRYVGQPILLRFEVLTDGSVTGRGFAIDDLAITGPGISYSTDFETAETTWDGDGFVWTGWQIPQQWAFLWIQEGQTPQITPLPLDIYNQGEWSLQVENDSVLVVMPLTPFIYEPANYWLAVE